MKAVLLNKEWNYYRFYMTNEEVCRRIFQCLSPMIPGMVKSDIYRDLNSKEFKVKLKGNCISVERNNLKRYLGAYVLCVEKDGVWFNRCVAAKK